MKLLGTVVCAILLAGGAYAVNSITREAGEDYGFTILAFPSTVASCHLTSPAGVSMDFTPGESSSHGDRYELQEIQALMPACTIIVRNLQPSDSGVWTVSFLNPSGTGTTSQFDLTVSGLNDSEIEDIEDNDEIDENIEWLKEIEFPTRTNQIIDISLPKTDHGEECTIRSPDGYYHRASELDIDGVKLHASSDYVSCRITIGPMIDSLLGKWAICGIHTEDNEKHERCQPATISWNNINRPHYLWETRLEEQFDHPVHFGSTLSPVVIGLGDIVSCHVVTPNGEDLVISHDSEYPGIRADRLAHSTCGAAIGPINNSMLGKWTVYGIFRNAVHGLDEVRLPITMFLYDDENPYNQAYNITVRDSVNRTVNLGNTLNIQVNVDAGQVDDCQFETPLGQVYDMKNQIEFTGAKFVSDDENDNVACQVAIGPMTETLIGDWKLIGKFSNSGRFTEIQQTFTVIQEDPENPIEEDRNIYYINDQTVLETAIGRTHEIVIHSKIFIHAESCHIRTPNGSQYILMEGFTFPGISVVEESGVECGITVNVLSEDVVGEWTLIARATRYSEPIERRLPFTINVEESVEALPNEITITEGNDLFVRLKHPTDQYETCKLIGPYGIECASAERDDVQVETCGFLRKNVQTFHSGTWTIMYGNRIIYKAEIVVTVNSENSGTESVLPTMNLVRDRFVSTAVGPENAVYCRLEDPQRLVVFDGFGRCNLTLDKVGSEHDGIWSLHVGAPNRITTDEYQLYVQVVESAGKAVVRTHVNMVKPIVTLSCSVESSYEVTSCKFRDPQGRILLAGSGVSEDRYEGIMTSEGSEVRTHECSIRITDPPTTDLGLWRCGIETTEETYYGHMLVMCPWVQENLPAVVATIQQEPVLKSERSFVSVLEEEPTTMSCSVQAAIRYCYFRAANGTIFNVIPGTSSSSMEYVGAGFDAGECGIRFNGMYSTDSGHWSCHVGLVGHPAEQRDNFQLRVHERMITDHYNSNVMVVVGTVHDQRALEYCRFVRIDGFGFTSESVPHEYTFTGIIANGECRLTARNPTILDLHPWTIVAKIRGQDVEISGDTMSEILITPPTTEPTPDQETPPVIINNPGSALAIFFYIFLSLLLVAIILGICAGPKRNREWTSRRACAFRNSITNRFQTKPPMPVPQNHNI